jgi:hypothetical protein
MRNLKASTFPLDAIVIADDAFIRLGCDWRKPATWFPPTRRLESAVQRAACASINLPFFGFGHHRPPQCQIGS